MPGLHVFRTFQGLHRGKEVREVLGADVGSCRPSLESLACVLSQLEATEHSQQGRGRNRFLGYIGDLQCWGSDPGPCAC